MSTTFPVDFRIPFNWGILIATLVFVVAPWAQIITFSSSGMMTSRRYAELQEAVGRTWIGGVVAGANWGLFVLQFILLLALFVVWMLYIVEGPSLPPNDFIYVWVNSLLVAAIVVHKFTETVFWQLRVYWFAMILRVLEFLLWLAVLIAELIEIFNITAAEENGINIALAIVVGIIWLYVTVVLLPRAIAFWLAVGLIGADVEEEEPMIIASLANPSLGSVQSKTNEHVRASHAAYANSPKSK